MEGKLVSVHIDVYDAIKGYEIKNDCIERKNYMVYGYGVEY